MAGEAYVPISSEIGADDISQFRRTACRQTGEAGGCIGKKAEFTLIAPLTKDGARIFLERLPKLQTEAGYWESRLGPVHDLRVALIDDAYILFAATYGADSKPDVLEAIRFAAPWIDHMFVDIADGFPGLGSPYALDYINAHQVEADLWYASDPDATGRAIARSDKMFASFNDLLDAAQS